MTQKSETNDFSSLLSRMEDAKSVQDCAKSYHETLEFVSYWYERCLGKIIDREKEVSSV